MVESGAGHGNGQDRETGTNEARRALAEKIREHGRRLSSGAESHSDLQETIDEVSRFLDREDVQQLLRYRMRRRVRDVTKSFYRARERSEPSAELGMRLGNTLENIGEFFEQGPMSELRPRSKVGKARGFGADKILNLIDLAVGSGPKVKLVGFVVSLVLMYFGPGLVSGNDEPTPPSLGTPVSVSTIAITSSTTGQSTTIRFTSGRDDNALECSLDEGRFQLCSSPKRYDDLSTGPHKFEVRTRNEIVDFEPATLIWTVEASAEPGPLVTTIDAFDIESSMAEFSWSSGASASGESPKFECRLDDSDWEDCQSSKIYPPSAIEPGNRKHKFEVRAVGNSATHTWVVNQEQ